MKIIVMKRNILLLLLFINGSVLVSARQVKNASKDTLAVITGRAQAGDIASQNLLASWYYEGDMVPQNYGEAVRWWTQSAGQDNAEGIGKLGLCYQFGHGVEADSLKAVDLCRNAMRKGYTAMFDKQAVAAVRDRSILSCLLLSECYRNGIGTQINVPKAEYYHELAADFGHVPSQFNVALYYLNSNRADKAVGWFKKASDNGVVGGTYYYGYLLFKGMGIPQDKLAGIEYLQKAEGQGFVAADYQLGKIFIEGDGIEQNDSLAFHYLSKATTNYKAQWLLGLCYLDGRGTPKDYYMAFQWLAESRKSHKDEFAQLLIDHPAFAHYLKAVRLAAIDHDYKRALPLFKNLGKEGVVEGRVMWAACHADSAYAKVNPKKAVRLLRKESSPTAAFFLYQQYRDGNGVNKDEVRAIELLTQAAEGGLAEAQCDLGVRYMDGDGVTQDYVKAARLFLAADKQFHLSHAAAKALAKCYELRIGNLPNLDKADECIKAFRNHKDNHNMRDCLMELATMDV